MIFAIVNQELALNVFEALLYFSASDTMFVLELSKYLVGDR